MILRYPGSKEKAGQDLLSLAPLSYDEYREPFCGNAAMLWHVPRDTNRWINDLDADVVNFMLYLQRGDLTRLHALRDAMLGQDADTVYREFRLQKLNWLNDDDPVAYWFLRRLAYGQQVRRSRNNLASFGYHHRINGLASCTRERATQAAEIMRNAKITRGDYTTLLDAPGHNVWLLIDPPYIVNCHNEPLYGVNMTEKQHYDLADRLRSCRHKFLLTIGYCGLAHDLYCRPPFYWSFRDTVYSSMIRSTNRHASELIVTNY